MIVPEPFDLSGTWALEVVVATVSDAPLFGVARSAARSRMVVELRRDGDAWTQRQSVCTTEMEGGTPLARVVLPAAWLHAMPPRAYPAALTRDGEGWAYAADTGVQVIGYDATRGPLPARAAEAHVVDADRDGRPGATVRVEVPGFGAAEVYVAQRGHSRLVGRVVRPDRIEGRVVIVDMAQATLGASHRIFDFSPSSRPDPARSTFAMWRVEAGTGCETLG